MHRAVPVLVLALAVAGTAAALDADSTPKPERQVSCWECHNVAVAAAPPITTFLELRPPGSAGAPVGVPFEYKVDVTNAWSAELREVRVALDLSGSPSLGFAGDAEPLAARVDDAIAVDPASLAAPQSKAVPVEVPDGEATMQATLTPGDQFADLTLVVLDPQGNEAGRSDAAGAGGPESFAIPDRSGFNEHGYGTWTFVAQAQVVGAGKASPTGLAGSIPFTLEVAAQPGTTGDRVVSQHTHATLRTGASTQATFRLVATALPGPGESAALSADAWAHYDHAVASTDDDENLTKVHPQPLQAGLDASGQPALLTETVVAVPRGVHNGPTMATLSEAVGYATALLMTTSVTTGGMFGKASRRGLNHLFGAAKRRVAFHNFLSYGILVAGSVHMALFLLEGAYAWTAGMLWGGLAILSLLGLGVTGALQVPIIRSWGYAAWRWTHYGLAVAALALTVAHGLLDGAHFTDVQDAVGWRDPLNGLSG